MKASTGLPTRGTRGLFSGWRDHRVVSGHREPFAIHVRISATSTADKGGPCLGILGGLPEIMRMSRLSSGFPGTMAFLTNAASWHWKHRVVRMPTALGVSAASAFWLV